MENPFSINRTGGLTFTKSQEKALYGIKKWYDSSSLMAVLYGKAGTGKTFLVNHILKNIINASVCVTAPTHKAVTVVEKATHTKGKTIHSLCGLRPNVNLETFNVNNMTFDVLGNETISSYRIIICDEFSQMNKHLMSLIRKLSIKYKVKVLFVGDSFQLPPVKERISSVMDIEEKWELTDIVRQALDNPIIKVLDMLREDIITQSNKSLIYMFNKKQEFNDRGEGYSVLTQREYQIAMLTKFKDPLFKANPDIVRHTGRTNDNVLEWNSFVRKVLMNNSETIVDINDIMVGYKTIVDEFNTPILVNSEDYIFKSVNPATTENGYSAFSVIASSILTGRDMYTQIIDHSNKEQFDEFIYVLRDLHFAAINASNNKGARWRDYYNFKDHHLTLVPIEIYKIGDNEYMNDDKTVAPKELDYGYGMTTHKLQGSTIDNIFINMIDMCYYYGNKQYPIKVTKTDPFALEFRNKLIYTAMSRAAKTVTILV